jgi:hypothetical protein
MCHPRGVSRLAWILCWSNVAFGCGGAQPDPAGGDSGSGSSTADGSSSGTAAASSSSDAADETGATACPTSTDVGIAVAPAPPSSLVDAPLSPWPDTLSGTGLYPDGNDLRIIADVALPYAPAWPLWSNGSDKQRYLVLPPGTAIDSSDPDRWLFPPGTLLFKTFAYEDADACLHPAETRVMRKTDEGDWDFAVYAWNAAATEADRLELDDPFPLDVEGPDGPFTHHVPTRLECRSCHESAIGEVLGFDRVQLSGPRAPGERDQLPALVAAGVLSHDSVPAPIEDPDADRRDVLGMFYGNCVHCHNGSDGPSSSFDLRPDVALANTIDRPTQSSASASGIRIDPGSPQTSILFLALSGETDDPEVSAMPPVGVDRRDAAAIELLRTFILALP